MVGETIVAIWPPDDTEESVVGTNLHQTTIVNARLGINEAATLLVAPDQPLPWQALDQIMVLGMRRRDGTAYTTFPDVFVYRRPIDPRRSSVSLAVDGPPSLIVEVLSESTYMVDLDLGTGKGFSYAEAGVREYLTIDPTGQYVPEQIRGWRLRDGVYTPWLHDAERRWRSEEIAVAFAVEGIQLVVYNRDGVRQLREGEIARALARKDADLARKDAEIAALRRLLDERSSPGDQR